MTCETFGSKTTSADLPHIYQVGQIKLGQCGFFRCSKARFREFW